MLVLAGRLMNAFKKTQFDVYLIDQGFRQWLIASAASLIGNPTIRFDEKLMKAISHVGGVRVPASQV